MLKRAGCRVGGGGSGGGVGLWARLVGRGAMWGRGGGGDTDLPLINADGDQGERQDDED